MKKVLCFLLGSLCLAISACAPAEQAKSSPLVHSEPLGSWEELSLRLQKDGFDAEKTEKLFADVGMPPSLSPMGTKIRELYSNKFLPKPKPKASPASASKRKKSPPSSLGIPGPWFKGTVTRANALKCKEFITSNSKAFTEAEKKYGVPAEVGAALLFVETRLGTFLGSQNAFYSLASMSVKRSPESMAHYLDELPGTWSRLGWIDERMEEKSEWAYEELKALLEYCWSNGKDPLSVPGSIYGAMGLCQFMPSNIKRFAEDGNGDGMIDLFSAPDAILSLSRYLSLNGWKKGMGLKGQVDVLMRYNRMRTYAHTILALAKTIENLDTPVRSRPSKAVRNKAKSFMKKPSKGKSPAQKKRWVSAKGRDVTAFID